MDSWRGPWSCASSFGMGAHTACGGGHHLPDDDHSSGRGLCPEPVVSSVHVVMTISYFFHVAGPYDLARKLSKTATWGFSISALKDRCTATSYEPDGFGELGLC